jgi:Flp pilus assembly protein TadG
MVAERIRYMNRQALTHVRRFSRQESGAVLVLGLIFFVIMLVIGGMAVDLMRYENRRTALQQTLDRCTLNAASLRQTLDPETVVRDCIDKVGLTNELQSVEVDEGLNFRNVETVASGTVDTFFMGMTGVNSLLLGGNAVAEERVSNVEISLVLDVSGSMAGTKLSKLKVAAKDFVSTILSKDSENRMSISIVPYNGQVNLGSKLLAKYNATDQHGVADVNCIDMPPEQYDVLGLSTTTPLPMTGDVDTYSSTSQSTSYVAYNTSNGLPNEANKWCPPRPENIVRLPNRDIGTLQGDIEGLSAVGATSINAGMKWGMALLDPGARDMFNEFVDTGDIPESFRDRPLDYRSRDAMKVIVLMTDGEHFQEERLNDGYRSGLSPIYKSAADGGLSIYHAGSGSNRYWVPARSEWRAAPWSNTKNNGVVTQLTWPQVWQEARLSWVAWQLYARALGTNSSSRTSAYNNALAAMRSRTPTGDMDDQLQKVCARAKTQGVIVYGIAFQASSNGAAQIRQCASSPAHYYDATTANISNAFQSIANNITQLRLTQ